jgi:hypothetical protein
MQRFSKDRKRLEGEGEGREQTKSQVEEIISQQ